MESFTYYPDEIVFLKKNFFSMTNQQLLDEINSKRMNPIRLPGMIHQCRRLGLKREIQIRWSTADTNFLIQNFRKIGNVELAELFNERQKTSRIIDGKKIFRKFTKKHIEKKMKLLELHRTPVELTGIKKRNIASGRIKILTSEDNYWTDGTRESAPENDVKIWKCSGYLRRVIKIEGHYIPYTRWFYNNFIEAITDDLKVYHIDLDSINDEPENLEARPYSGISLREYQRALPLIQQRIKIHMKEKCETREEEKNWQKQLRHLRNVENSIRTNLDKLLSRNNSIHLKKQLEPIQL